MRFLVPHDSLPRDAYEFLHEDCGGIYERVDCTKAELKKFNCGKDYECCARAFVCVRCKDRIAMHVDAPEME
jgi:hypothetical protein